MCINRLYIVIILSSILNDIVPESFWACNVTVIRYWADSNLWMKISSCIFCWASYLRVQEDSTKHCVYLRVQEDSIKHCVYLRVQEDSTKHCVWL